MPSAPTSDGRAQSPDGVPEEVSPPATPTLLAMIPRSFSEHVSVSPSSQGATRRYASLCTYETGQRFRTAAEFVPCLVPRHYISSIRVDESGVTYFDGVHFAPSIRTRRREETIISYPKHPVLTFTSTLCHAPDARERYYISGLELVPSERLKVESVTPDPVSCPRRPSSCQEESSSLRNGDMPQALVEGAA